MFLILTLLSLLGCPAPVEEVAPGVPGPGAPGAPGEGAPQPPPPGDAAAPPADGAAGATTPPPPGAPATDLSALITGDKVKITGTLEGSKTARVNVLQPGATAKDVPNMIAAFDVTDGTFTLDAPATLEKPLYFAAFADLTGDGPSPDDLSAGTESGVKLEGKDVAVTLKLGTDQGWVKRMPWPAPEGGPPGGAPPGAPPPGGPPPANAPGANGGPVAPPPADAPPAGGEAPPAPK